MIDQLFTLEGVQTFPGAPEAAFAELGVTLPEDHQRLLMRSNGISAFHGYVRLFGIKNSALSDLSAWNNAEHWKFAWCGRCDEFFCFGETAWGDQYAYKLEDLLFEREAVFFLDSGTMSVTPLTTSFADFFQQEFVRVALEPYDSMMVAAYQKFGRIDLDDHIIYAPPLLLGADDAIENVQRMPSRTAMIINGDVATQFDQASDNAMIKGVLPYFDEVGRPRMKLLVE